LRRAADVGRGGIEVWSSGALEARYRRRDVEAWRYGCLAVRGRRSDNGGREVSRHGALDSEVSGVPANISRTFRGPSC